MLMTLKKLIRNKGMIMKKLQMKQLGFPFLLCSSLLISACDNSKNSMAENDKIQPEDKVMQELITEPVKAFEKTPNDQHDIALLTDFDQRFTQMSDDMEDELSKMREAGSLTNEFAHQRKRDNIQSALNMLKELDLKTEQGRYIQGLYYQYWENQAKVYQELKQSTDNELANPTDAIEGMSDYYTAQAQLEHWQQQTAQ